MYSSNLEVIPLIIFILVVVAYCLSIDLLVEQADKKGSDTGAGKLWFIGFFTTPIVLGIIVTAMPDRGAGSLSRGHFVINAAPSGDDGNDSPHGNHFRQ